MLLLPTTKVAAAPTGTKVHTNVSILGRKVAGWFFPADPRTTQPPHLGVVWRLGLASRRAEGRQRGPI